MNGPNEATRNPGECASCHEQAQERCNDDYCRACHKSLGFEECCDGPWANRQRAAAGLPPMEY